jgi:hypothetical protein
MSEMAIENASDNTNLLISSRKESMALFPFGLTTAEAGDGDFEIWHKSTRN